MHFVDHLLAFFLVVVGPIWDYFGTRPLKANPSGAARLHYYRQTFVWLWITTGVACSSDGFAPLMTLHGLGVQGMWLKGHWGWWLLAAIVTLAVLFQLLLPVVQVIVKYRNRPFLEPRQFEALRFFLPSSALERCWFGAFSVTAGFCEELLFRGFLLHYLHGALNFPWVWAALASAVAFGTHHLYLGRKGFVPAGTGGLLLTAMLIVTGSLWAGMVCHAATDLSMLLYWRPRLAANAAA